MTCYPQPYDRPMPKPFASSADLTEKRATLEQLADGVYAFTAEGDPSVGCIVGTHAILATQARATPATSGEGVAHAIAGVRVRIRRLTGWSETRR